MFPVDVYVLSKASQPPFTKKQIAVSNNQCVASKMFVKFITLDAKDGPFVIIPATSDPHQHATFTLQLISPMDDVYDVKPLK